MSLTLYRKWRPQVWDQVVGQDHVILTLKNAVSTGRFAHAFIFAGPRGTGKTTTARLLAKAVDCLHEDPSARPCEKCAHCEAINRGRFLDLIEIDAASNTSVEDVRDLRDKINFSPNQGRYKVYIIDEVHMLSTAAFNALLKTLEEPPPHAIFILATTEVQKIPATVLSRCQRHEFRRIPVMEIVPRLEKIVHEENLDAEIEALKLIARQSTGSMRDAISLLDQLASSGKPVSLELVEKLLGTVASQSVLEIIDHLAASDPVQGFTFIHKTLDSGTDPRLLARQLVDHFRNMLLCKLGNAAEIDASMEVKAHIARHAQIFEADAILACIRAFSLAANEARSTWQPSLPLEMAFVEAMPEWQQIVSSKRATTPPGVDGGKIATPASTPHQVKTDPVGQSLNSESISDGHELEITLNLKMVTDRWRQILSALGQRSKQVEGLLNSCRPYGVKGGALYLGFNGDFTKNKMEQDDNMNLAQQVLEQVLGVPVCIKCFVAGSRRGELPPDIDNDGIVAAALRDLGGEIVDIQ